MTEVAVVGGGVSGLATAVFARAADPTLRITLLESSPRLGGNVRTLQLGGMPVEAGPDALLVGRREVDALVDQLGLGGELAPPCAGARCVLVAARGALRPLPEGLVMGVPTRLGQLATTDLLSPLGKLRALLDLFLPARPRPGESVGALVARRLGPEVRDRLVEPVLGGIYAADVDRLDPTVGLPPGVHRGGSLLRAMARTPRGKGSPLRAPRSGMGRLVGELSARLGEGVVRREIAARWVRPEGRGWTVATSAGDLRCDRLVLAVPPAAAVTLLGGVDPDLASGLSDLRAATTASVILVFPPGTPLPAASGVLLPRDEGKATLAATFVNAKWGRGSSTGEVVIRAVVGGARSPDLVARETDDGLVALALADLRAYLPLPDPTSASVVRHLDGTPQPEVGHPERVARVRSLADRHFGLSLVSAAYEGPGLAGCIAQASRAAASLVPS